MNGFLMQEKAFRKGTDAFIESHSSENKYGVIFEDDGDMGYFYAVETDPEKPVPRILDALHIYDALQFREEEKLTNLAIIWSRDWLKCALVLDELCHAVFDFDKQAGYNINEFPPPNAFWTKGERKLTNALIRELF
jgi:hypothetical protein